MHDRSVLHTVQYMDDTLFISLNHGVDTIYKVGFRGHWSIGFENVDTTLTYMTFTLGTETHLFHLWGKQGYGDAIAHLIFSFLERNGL